MPLFSFADWNRGISDGFRPVGAHATYDAQHLHVSVLADVRNYLPTFLAVFSSQVGKSLDFIYDQANGAPVSTATLAPGVGNVLTCEGLDVEVATVHRVKGETHAATLYMESFYERGGGGNYESERLAGQLAGEAFGAKVHDLVRQSAKMMYAGFSRPTHLLCFAVHECRFVKFEAGIDRSVWDVVRL